MSKYTNFGLKAKISMLEQDMSVPDLAKIIGISRQYLLDILKGSRPGNSQKKKIADVLKIKEG